MANINWDVLGTVTGAFVSHVGDEAMIRKDPDKGIHEDVVVPFTKPVFAVASKEQASDLFDTLGADVFNGLLNYASDLRRRGNATQTERSRLTADPLKKELKSLANLDFSEAQQTVYIEARRNGASQKQALAKVLAG